MDVTAHKPLTLDFWQDSVTYEGQTMPSEMLACATLNIPNETIERLSQFCTPLNFYMGQLQREQAQWKQRRAAWESTMQIAELLRNTPPFSVLDYSFVREEMDKIFLEDYLQTITDFSAVSPYQATVI